MQLALLMACFAYAPLQAQIQKGQVFLGGSFSAENQLYGPKTFSVSVKPEIGLMLSSKWGVGIGIPLRYDKYISQRQFDPNVSLLVRRYFDLKSGFYVFLQLQAQSGFPSKDKITKTNLSVELLPALSYFVNRHFALEAGFAELTL
jgi:hypothetical protein